MGNFCCNGRKLPLLSDSNRNKRKRSSLKQPKVSTRPDILLPLQSHTDPSNDYFENQTISFHDLENSPKTYDTWDISFELDYQIDTPTQLTHEDQVQISEIFKEQGVDQELDGVVDIVIYDHGEQTGRTLVISTQSIYICDQHDIGTVISQIDLTDIACIYVSMCRYYGLIRSQDVDLLFYSAKLDDILKAVQTVYFLQMKRPIPACSCADYGELERCRARALGMDNQQVDKEFMAIVYKHGLIGEDKLLLSSAYKKVGENYEPRQFLLTDRAFYELTPEKRFIRRVELLKLIEIKEMTDSIVFYTRINVEIWRISPEVTIKMRKAIEEIRKASYTSE